MAHHINNMQDSNIPSPPDTPKSHPIEQPIYPAQGQFPNQPPSNTNSPNNPQKSGMPTAIIIVVGMFVLFIFAILISTCNKTRNVGGREDSLAVVTAIDTTTTALNSTEEQIKRWNETSEKDEMTDVMSYWSTLISDNTVYFDFPYEGGSELKITVRYMKKYGTDVIISISQGQMLCNEYNGTNYVTVRFDDTPAKKYYTNEPADGSPDNLFLNNPKDFINRAKTAKTIKIEVPFYQEGNHVFTFTVDEPLKWEH